MEGPDDADLERAVEDAIAPPPDYLTLPLAERGVMMTPGDLVDEGQLRCRSKGRVVGAISNGLVAVPVQREFRCERQPEHEGPHILFIGSAGAPELSWVYSWDDPPDSLNGGG